MYKLTVIGKRSFIVKKEDVIHGGRERTFPGGGNVEGKPIVINEVELYPGRVVYQVTNNLGKKLERYPDVNVLEIDGKEVPHEDKIVLSPEERIEQLEAQIKELLAKVPKEAKA